MPSGRPPRAADLPFPTRRTPLGDFAGRRSDGWSRLEADLMLSVDQDDAVARTGREDPWSVLPLTRSSTGDRPPARRGETSSPGGAPGALVPDLRLARTWIQQVLSAPPNGEAAQNFQIPRWAGGCLYRCWALAPADSTLSTCVRSRRRGMRFSNASSRIGEVARPRHPISLRDRPIARIASRTPCPSESRATSLM